MYVSISYYVGVVIMLLLTLCDGNNDTCDIEPCLHMYNNLKSLLDTIVGDNQRDDLSHIMSSRICPLQQDLSICIESQSKICRGDLYFHFVKKLVKDITARVSKNCTELRGNNNSGGGSSERRGSNKNDRNSSRNSGSRHNFDNFDTSQGKCVSKLKQPIEPPMVGCALYGVTNLKGFSDSLNLTNIPYCSLSGAWSLIDTPEFTIQITNKGGFNPMPKDTTTTTLVTVIIRSNECSIRKTYQATFEEVPHMFLDGTTRAKSVYIEIIKESEHIKIHLPYLLTTIDIFKLIGHLPLPSLSITIKMPAANLTTLLSDTKQIRGLPLCFYGCPKTASIRPRSIVPSTSHKCPTPPPPSSSSSSSSSISSEISSNLPSNIEPPSNIFEFSNHQDNSISSAVCESLYNVKNILGQVSILEQRIHFPGEENYAILNNNNNNNNNNNIDNDHHHDTNINSKSYLSNNERRFGSSVENSALTSQSVGNLYYNYYYYYLFLYFNIILYRTCFILVS